MEKIEILKQTKTALFKIGLLSSTIPPKKRQEALNETLSLVKLDQPLPSLLKSLNYKINFWRLAFPMAEIDEKALKVFEEKLNENEEYVFIPLSEFLSTLIMEINPEAKKMQETPTPPKPDLGQMEENSRPKIDEVLFGKVTYEFEQKKETTKHSPRVEPVQKEESNGSPNSKEGVQNFVYKNGRIQMGEAEKRALAEHSNWVAANADPDDLRKHKELLDRQYFRGPTWEGKKTPMSILDEKNPEYYEVEKEDLPNRDQTKEAVEGRFEKVKR